MVTAAIWDGFPKAAAFKPADPALGRMSQQQKHEFAIREPDGMS
jgi:hypothetical protein